MGEKIEKLDIHKFSDEIKSISIGKLSDEMIKFIVSKNPEFEKRLNNSNDILFYARLVFKLPIYFLHSLPYPANSHILVDTNYRYERFYLT